VTVKAAGLGMHVGEQWLFRGLDLGRRGGECPALRSFVWRDQADQT
jgi:hypothetical protein